MKKGWVEPHEKDPVNGRFLKGYKGGPGRGKGRKNNADLLLESLPLKVRQWIKSESPEILREARQLVAKSDSRVSLPSDKSQSLDGDSSKITIVLVNASDVPALRDWHTPETLEHQAVASASVTASENV